MTATPKIRCAIYTRKSSDEGLDQDFNSLDAQFEACAAYVTSQKQEGWVLARGRFDDGGLSGGTMERPALQRLLAEIDARRIGMVVVYKIDRLTRSLADFARLVERLDAAGCSFVSVTQAFNTASSMGRLTLNVLLSFAQFEREVTAERIRDKIAASKKKGLWMGGVPPLGYDPHPDPNTRELVINADEAPTVQSLFDLYDQHGSLATVEREADHLGLRSKHHRFRSGREQGGNRMSGGQIHKILLNPVYLGKTRHKDKLWPGKHAAIIDEDLWDRVQQKLQLGARRSRGRALGGVQQSLLTGKLCDDTGDRLTPTHSTKSGRRHRYYISNRLISGGTDPTGWRLPARGLEKSIVGLIADHIDRAATARRLLALPDLRGDGEVQQAAKYLVQRLRKQDPDLLRTILASGTVAPQEIRLTLDKKVVATSLGVAERDLATDLCDIQAPLQLRRRGVEARLVIGESRPTPDAILTQALREAHHWAQALKNGTPLKSIAAETNCTGAFIRKRGQLAFLSPRIQVAIRDGTLPPNITTDHILRQRIPLDWMMQERMFEV
ncbi:recombinase family protein [Sulfitobacter sp. JL08]|uniref:recombinase family protein n=1 Tax=Sulfitobacter sp. JL08 TaxID=2070369 RepID=UPI000E0B8786|nr:recombinase family protein [Sulfitobacter sp. JL08]AXI55101.1 recombinase family protein [Sulfitobacter sp. JL08]